MAIWLIFLRSSGVTRFAPLDGFSLFPLCLRDTLDTVSFFTSDTRIRPAPRGPLLLNFLMEGPKQNSVEMFCVLAVYLRWQKKRLQRFQRNARPRQRYCRMWSMPLRV